MTLKGRTTKREVPDKSGNYKNLSEARSRSVLDYTFTLPMSFSTSARSLQTSSTVSPVMIPLR